MIQYIKTILVGYCPKCKKAKLFKNRLSFSTKRNLEMHEYCPACGQKTELEVGFYYGTGYVSYALTIAVSVGSLGAFWIIGTSPISSTYALILWLVINTGLLIILQPIIMRVSRMIWLSWFV